MTRKELTEARVTIEQRLYACDCAERALPIFERQHPDDKRPREAIEIARAFAVGEASEEEMDAAWNAAWYTVDDIDDIAGGARAAARAAACAASPELGGQDAIKNVQWIAVWAIAEANAQIVGGSIKDATRDTARGTAWAVERKWQIDRLGDYLVGKVVS